MTPKDRVRANIYKTLLEEEKRKTGEGEYSHYLYLYWEFLQVQLIRCFSRKFL